MLALRRQLLGAVQYSSTGLGAQVTTECCPVDFNETSSEVCCSEDATAAVAMRVSVAQANNWHSGPRAPPSGSGARTIGDLKESNK